MATCILKAKYFPTNSFLTDQLEWVSDPWRMAAGSRWRMGFGTNINVWNDPWINGSNTFKPSTPVVDGLQSLTVVDYGILIKIVGIQISYMPCSMRMMCNL